MVLRKELKDLPGGINLRYWRTQLVGQQREKPGAVFTCLCGQLPILGKRRLLCLSPRHSQAEGSGPHSQRRLKGHEEHQQGA
ncbi:MAG: hypothetical protein O2811_06365 [Proteobacteria bacterium]|nr:hypothetical protein [Pseudomonadota bacterium]